METARQKGLASVVLPSSRRELDRRLSWLRWATGRWGCRAAATLTTPTLERDAYAAKKSKFSSPLQNINHRYNIHLLSFISITESEIIAKFYEFNFILLQNIFQISLCYAINNQFTNSICFLFIFYVILKVLVDEEETSRAFCY